MSRWHQLLVDRSLYREERGQTQLEEQRRAVQTRDLEEVFLVLQISPVITKKNKNGGQTELI